MPEKLTAEELGDIKRRLVFLPIDEDWANETERWVLAYGSRLLTHIEALEGELRDEITTKVTFRGQSKISRLELAESEAKVKRQQAEIDALRSENERLREQVGVLEAVLECHACGRTNLHSSWRRLDQSVWICPDCTEGPQ